MTQAQNTTTSQVTPRPGESLTAAIIREHQGNAGLSETDRMCANARDCEQALVLYRHLQKMRRDGVRLALITLPRRFDDEPLKVSPIGQRVEIHTEGH
jgi:hypothetical protein